MNPDPIEIRLSRAQLADISSMVGPVRRDTRAHVRQDRRRFLRALRDVMGKDVSYRVRGAKSVRFVVVDQIDPAMLIATRAVEFLNETRASND